jgi:hypothetical protein
MRDRDLLFQDIRVLVSGCAALLASLLCHNLGHFTIILSQPSTWYLPAEHRCGWVLIVASTWFLFEAANRLRKTRNIASQPQHSTHRVFIPSESGKVRHKEHHQ